MTRQLSAECFRLLRSPIFWEALLASLALYSMALLGRHQSVSTALEAYGFVMRKCIGPLMAAAAFDGAFVGEELRLRTLGASVASGNSRVGIVFASILSLWIAQIVLCLLFPCLFATCCGLQNGWGQATWRNATIELISRVSGSALLVMGNTAIVVPMALLFDNASVPIALTVFSICCQVAIANVMGGNAVVDLFPVACLVRAGIGEVGLAGALLVGFGWSLLGLLLSYAVMRRKELR